jgi:hypothetical protein
MRRLGSNMRGLGVVILAFALSGCAGNQPGRGQLFASKAEIEAKDDSTCRQYGAKPGEPVYIQCRVARCENNRAETTIFFGATLERLPEIILSPIKPRIVSL